MGSHVPTIPSLRRSHDPTILFPVTYLTVSIAVAAADEVERSLERAEEAVSLGARMVEWRIDRLAERPEDVEAARALVRRSPAPSIATCRGRDEGGLFDGDETQRATLLETLLREDQPPRYIDIEWRAFGSGLLRDRITAALRERADRDGRTSLILSVHDFERRPPALLRHLEAMTSDSACDVVKIAWFARSVRDNLEAFELLAERRKPMIALCMGPFGLASRVLAPKFGGLLSYASVGPQDETAPGQPTVESLRDVFRFERIGPDTAVYGVIGWPVAHSAGPAVHNAGFEAIGRDAVYLPFPVPPEYEHFKATVASLLDASGLNFRGASITLPHKENLLRFTQERGGRIDAGSRRIGAANTLEAGDDGAISCSNTDAPAAVAVLCDAMGLEPSGLAGTRVAVLGAGGVARAVVGALSHAGAAVTVFNRTPERAEALAARFDGVEAGPPQAAATEPFDVLVNCTPVGMAGGPAPDRSPLPPDILLNGRITVMDTVYTPRRTPLLAEAERRGARIVEGREMFLRQAGMQFERWTGEQAPMEVFRRAVD